MRAMAPAGRGLIAARSPDATGAGGAIVLPPWQIAAEAGKGPVAEAGQGLEEGQGHQAAEKAVEGSGRKGLPDRPEGLDVAVDAPVRVDGVHLVHQLIATDPQGGRIEFRGADVDEEQAAGMIAAAVMLDLGGADAAGAVVVDAQGKSRAFRHGMASLRG